jgi:hypothetical protein
MTRMPGLAGLALHARGAGFPDLSRYLLQRYVEEQRSGPEIAEEAGVSTGTVYNALHAAGIPRRHHGYARVVAARARTREEHRRRRAALRPPAPFADWATYLLARRRGSGHFQLSRIVEETKLSEKTIRLLIHEHLGVALGPMFHFRPRAEMRARRAALAGAEPLSEGRTGSR